MRRREIIEGKEHILVFLQAIHGMGILAAIGLYEVIVRFEGHVFALCPVHLMLCLRLHTLGKLV